MRMHPGMGGIPPVIDDSEYLVPRDVRERLHAVSTQLCYCSARIDMDRAVNGEPRARDWSDLAESEEAVLSPLFADGYELIGTGAGRCVLRFPEHSELRDHVVKVARFGDTLTTVGMIQNHREAFVWAHNGQNSEWPLLPVADYHRLRYRWLVMPYGTALESLPEEKRSELCHQLRARLRLFPQLNIQEVRADNAVLWQEQPYLADYGRPLGA